MGEAPGYWMDEQTGCLRPAVVAYLKAAPLSEAQIAALRAYCRQWVHADGFAGPDVDELRAMIDGLTSREALDSWMLKAMLAGIDPL
jgi:hypothetical protein